VRRRWAACGYCGCRLTSVLKTAAKASDPAKDESTSSAVSLRSMEPATTHPTMSATKTKSYATRKQATQGTGARTHGDAMIIVNHTASECWQLEGPALEGDNLG